MLQRKDGGKIMSKKLNIDSDPKAWLPAFDKLLFGKEAMCPHCNSAELDFEAIDFGEGVGFMRATCTKCDRTGYISRYKFPKGSKVTVNNVYVNAV